MNEMMMMMVMKHCSMRNQYRWNENMVFHNALQVMSHIRLAVVNNIIIHVAFY